MRHPILVVLFGTLLALAAVAARAGDSLYGKIVDVRSADVVVLDYGTGKYVVHIIGVELPRDTRAAAEAKDFVSKLLLNKNARVRLGSRLENGDLVGRLLADDAKLGVRDVGLELLRTGRVRRLAAEDSALGYPYGELTAAEREAREARRGLWSDPNVK